MNTQQIIAFSQLDLTDVIEASHEIISGGIVLIQVAGEDGSYDITIDRDGYTTRQDLTGARA